MNYNINPRSVAMKIRSLARTIEKTDLTNPFTVGDFRKWLDKERLYWDELPSGKQDVRRFSIGTNGHTFYEVTVEVIDNSELQELQELFCNGTDDMKEAVFNEMVIGILQVDKEVDGEFKAWVNHNTCTALLACPDIYAPEAEEYYNFNVIPKYTWLAKAMGLKQQFPDKGECGIPGESRNQPQPSGYVYGMRMRGFSIGCQPKRGFVECKDDPSGKYHDLLVYDRPLTDEELTQYELDYLESVA